MSILHEYTTVLCDFDKVSDRLYAHFDGDAAIVPLRVKVGDLHVEREVEIHLADRPGYPGYRLLNVSWEPKDGGPYPTFTGTLSIAQEGAGWSRIDLDGSYTPPFGAFGAAFDATVGHRIAQATATELLAEFKRLLADLAAA